ncbi:HD-GYP domain-containing protein [Niallia circulans]|uniref:HD-GYP domain-containing protein n=1 Tax=Niallia circulans TaxID=1397 RepID=A0A553SHK6_NIACI|nr:HD-GYP domain-containing protein [Niallia circulans]TRZ36474.1 HD-GYP domain-containing protein [Niallia circulans]
MNINVDRLIAGCILTEDVFSMTNRPIITSKTVLTDEHINLLKVFQVKKVEIENTQIDGNLLSELTEANQFIEDDKESFFDKFLYGVSQYKKEFRSWQSGVPLSIPAVRAILLPLLEDLEQYSKEVFSLYHLSNKQEYIYQHSVAVGVISALIAHKMGYNKGETIQIAMAGCLSDAGMSKIPHGLLTKEEPLTEEEFSEVKRHTSYSLKMLPEHSLLKKETRLAILQHHERLDGSGYPLGNADNKIHPYAKIIAVSDTFHAMTSQRLYRSKQSPFKVLEKLQQDYFGKFDHVVLQALSNSIIQYTIGSTIRLSNGHRAEVVFVEGRSATRPLVKILEDQAIMDLEKNRHLYIEEVLQFS